MVSLQHIDLLGPPVEDPERWREGPPPHIGWWNASAIEDPNVWRWWNGKWWSIYVERNHPSWDRNGRRECCGLESTESIRWRPIPPPWDQE